MTEWIISCDPNRYKIDDALHILRKIDWQQCRNICVGDSGYIYVNRPIAAIKYICKVNKVDLIKVEIDDSIFCLNNTDFNHSDRYMEVELIHHCDSKGLSLKQLQDNGMNGHIQGPRKVVGELKKYIDRVIKFENYSVKAELLDAYMKDQEQKAQKMSFDELRVKAEEKSSIKVAHQAVIAETYIRNPYVAEYAKVRANGICQLCASKAPFSNKDGRPYLESHHIIWLSKDGADSLENTVALCPNCHKKMHVVNDEKDVERLKRFRE